MTDTIIVAILSCMGTLTGSVVSVLTANRITNYKIQRLEEEVKDLKNKVTDVFELEKRTIALETKVANIEVKLNEK